MSGPWEEFRKPKVGPWTEYQKSPEAAESSTSAGQAALESFGNTVTLGYLPHLQALTEKLMPDPNADLDENLKSQGFNVADTDPTYPESRDANLKRLDLEEREHPTASTLGKVAGFAASAALPAGQIAKGASLGAKAAQGAKVGGLYGVIANPGDAEGEMGPQILERIKGGAIGAATGAAIPVALDKASGASSRVSEYLKKKAEALAEKATGATGKQSERFVEGTGRELLDRGVVKFGSSPTGIARNATRAMDAAEMAKDEIIGTKLKGTNVDRNAIYNKIRERIAELKGDESQTALVKNLESKLDDILQVADDTGAQIPISKSEEVRRGFDKAAKWDSASDAPTREANKILANAYRDAGEEAANLADPVLGAKFKDAKSTQHLLIPVAEAAEKRAAQLKQSPLGGLLDWAAAGAGGTIGGFPGMAAGVAVKGARPRIPAAAAVTSDAISRQAAKGASTLADARVRPGISQSVTDAISRKLGFESRFDEDSDSILKNPKLMDIFRKDPSRIDAIRDDKLRNMVKRALKIPNRKVSSE